MDIENKLQILLKSVTNDNTSGSISIAKNIIKELRFLAIEFTPKGITKIAEFIPTLKQAKPTMSAIDNILTFIKYKIDQKGINNISDVFDNTISLIEKSISDSINNAVQSCTRTFSSENLNIVTTSFSSTVLSFLKKLKDIKNFKVCVLESQFEGVKHSLNFVQACKSSKIDAQEISSQTFLREKIKLDYAIIGADRIIYNEAVVNGTPSLLLAEGAIVLGIPFFVIAESLKRSDKIIIAEGYDLIPWNYITKLFTDNVFENIFSNKTELQNSI